MSLALQNQQVIVVELEYPVFEQKLHSYRLLLSSLSISNPSSIRISCLCCKQLGDAVLQHLVQ